MRLKKSDAESASKDARVAEVKLLLEEEKANPNPNWRLNSS